ncbi:hypothetical protein SANA_29620 [Gottschalkiaceae bacterium SANA]|nr:hypothetical protein SANA_29620 [Gottschalkiaceae bacterium SANA]
MKRSLINNTYKSTANRFGIFLLFLVLFFGLIITLCSQIYVHHFTSMSKDYYTGKFSTLCQATELKVAHWHMDDDLLDQYELENVDALNTYFESDLLQYGALDSHILLARNGYESYSYKGKIIPAPILKAAENQLAANSLPQYQWIQNKLWLIHAKNENDYTLALATPISGNNLAFLNDWWYGQYIQSANVTQENIHKNRNLFNWEHLTMSYLIDENTNSYLTIEYKLDTLHEYFYIGYGVVLLTVLLTFMLVCRSSLKKSFQSALDQVTIFETQVSRIASGDYSKRVKHSGFIELIQLEDNINQLSVVIQAKNEKLKEDVKELYDILIEVLEQKDPYTRGHSERVAKYSLQIGQRIGYQNLDQLYSSALLHDIGKISISGSILRKPGKLTEFEYDAIKTHPQKGFQLLLKSSQFESILDGVLYHHERLDGSGYPCGLEDQEIPMMAKIIAVADVYDALTSDRSYRKAMSVQQAVAIIRDGQGTLFDYDIVESLFTCIESVS